MAKFDHGGGCACGLYKTCDCEVHSKENNTTRTFKKPEEKRYIMIRRDDDSAVIVHGEDELKEFMLTSKDKNCRFHELGPEVEIKVSVSVKSKGVVYRDADVR